MTNALTNVHALERSLMQEVIHFTGTDKEMANCYAADRNDVIEARELFQKDEIEMLKGHIINLDTYIRDGVVMAFIKDMGATWVETNLGWRA